RSCAGPADVPRLPARRLPLSCAGPAGDEPPRARRADGPARGAADRRGVADRAVKRRDLPSEFHAAAPVRLDFAGGWTDVPPFSAREGGVVVSAAIDLTAHVALQLGGPRIRLVSEDLGQELECVDSGGLVLDGRLDLLKAALRMFPVRSPCILTTRSEAPPGSGLGSSGAMDVALVGALALARADRLSEREIAEQAWYLETVEARIPGGKQDQFAAALGGFQRLTFHDPDVGVEPITLDPAFAAALERRTVLCYTGRSRMSGATIARVMAAYERGDPGVTGALRAMKQVAAGMAEALRAANLTRVAQLLTENWTQQRSLDPEMCTPEMAQLEQAVTTAKALLSVDGGVCPDDGTTLAFDPWSPAEHRCPRCGQIQRGERHDRNWARDQHLWLAERAAHLATLAALAGDAAAAGRATEILRGYVRTYWQYPNRDNVLGPSRLFFSTYLESIWLCNY